MISAASCISSFSLILLPYVLAKETQSRGFLLTFFLPLFKIVNPNFQKLASSLMQISSFENKCLGLKGWLSL